MSAATRRIQRMVDARAVKPIDRRIEAAKALASERLAERHRNMGNYRTRNSADGVKLSASPQVVADHIREQP